MSAPVYVEGPPQFASRMGGQLAEITWGDGAHSVVLSVHDFAVLGQQILCERRLKFEKIEAASITHLLEARA